VLPLACWGCGFECPRGAYIRLSVVSVVQVSCRPGADAIPFQNARSLQHKIWSTRNNVDDFVFFEDMVREGRTFLLKSRLLVYYRSKQGCGNGFFLRYVGVYTMYTVAISRPETVPETNKASKSHSKILYARGVTYV
jgi:hypothetical protein